MTDEQTLTEAEVAALDAEVRPSDDTTPESGTDAQGDGADSSPSVPSPTHEEIEKRLAQIDKAAEQYAAKVARIMGEDFAMLMPSPFDWKPGFIFNPEVQPPDPEQVAAMQAFLGLADEAEMKDAPDAQPCEACNALGRVKTGSRVAGQETKPCIACGGSGWRAKVTAATPAPSFSVGTPAGVIPLQPNQPPQVADQWGRQFGHPHYGLDPAQVGV